MSDAIEVLKREKKYMKLHCGAISNGQWIPRDLGLAFDEALLALEKQKNGLKCIGCGSIPKLKLCCNSCYQRLKLKEKRQVELIEWLEKEINSSGNRLRNAQLNGNSKRQTTSMTRIKVLKEVLDMVGEQK